MRDQVNWWCTLTVGIAMLICRGPAVAAASDCHHREAAVHAWVLYHGPGFWSVSICKDGTFQASAPDAKSKGRLSSTERERLEALLLALPRLEKSYDFGVHHIDAPALGVTLREDERQYKYFVGDDVSAERGNPGFPGVAHLATFMRRLFASSEALDTTEWFAPGLERDNNE